MKMGFDNIEVAERICGIDLTAARAVQILRRGLRSRLRVILSLRRGRLWRRGCHGCWSRCARSLSREFRGRGDRSGGPRLSLVGDAIWKGQIEACMEGSIKTAETIFLPVKTECIETS